MERTNIVAGRIGGQNLDALFFHPQPCLSPHRPGDLCAEVGPSGSTNGFRIPRVDGPIQDDHRVHTKGPGSPDECAQVTGVLQPIQEQYRGRGADPELGEIEARLAAYAQDTLRVLGIREVGQLGIGQFDIG